MKVHDSYELMGVGMLVEEDNRGIWAHVKGWPGDTIYLGPYKTVPEASEVGRTVVNDRVAKKKVFVGK